MALNKQHTPNLSVGIGQSNAKLFLPSSKSSHPTEQEHVAHSGHMLIFVTSLSLQSQVATLITRSKLLCDFTQHVSETLTSVTPCE